MGLVLGQGLKFFEITEQILQAPQCKEEMSRFSPRNDKTSTDTQDRRSARTYYGCGEPGVIKTRCPKCSPSSMLSSPRVGNVIFQLCSTKPTQITLLNITVNGLPGTACVDSRASHCIAGELLYEILKKKEGLTFRKTQLTKSLADGTKNEVETYTNCVVVGLEGRVIKTNLISLPYAKENRTILGIDFLKDAGVVLDLKDQNWYFNDFSCRKFEFVEDATPCNINTMTTESNFCQLREDKDNSECHLEQFPESTRKIPFESVDGISSDEENSVEILMDYTRRTKNSKCKNNFELIDCAQSCRTDEFLSGCTNAKNSAGFQPEPEAVKEALSASSLNLNSASSIQKANVIKKDCNSDEISLKGTDTCEKNDFSNSSAERLRSKVEGCPDFCQKSTFPISMNEKSNKNLQVVENLPDVCESSHVSIFSIRNTEEKFADEKHESEICEKSYASVLLLHEMRENLRNNQNVAYISGRSDVSVLPVQQQKENLTDDRDILANYVKPTASVFKKKKIIENIESDQQISNADETAVLAIPFEHVTRNFVGDKDTSELSFFPIKSFKKSNANCLDKLGIFEKTSASVPSMENLAYDKSVFDSSTKSTVLVSPIEKSDKYFGKDQNIPFNCENSSSSALSIQTENLMDYKDISVIYVKPTVSVFQRKELTENPENDRQTPNVDKSADLAFPTEHLRKHHANVKETLVNCETSTVSVLPKKYFKKNNAYSQKNLGILDKSSVSDFPIKNLTSNKNVFDICEKTTTSISPTESTNKYNSNIPPKGEKSVVSILPVLQQKRNVTDDKDICVIYIKPTVSVFPREELTENLGNDQQITNADKSSVLASPNENVAVDRNTSENYEKSNISVFPIKIVKEDAAYCEGNLGTFETFSVSALPIEDLKENVANYTNVCDFCEELPILVCSKEKESKNHHRGNQTIPYNCEENSAMSVSLKDQYNGKLENDKDVSDDYEMSDILVLAEEEQKASLADKGETSEIQTVSKFPIEGSIEEEDQYNPDIYDKSAISVYLNEESQNNIVVDKRDSFINEKSTVLVSQVENWKTFPSSNKDIPDTCDKLNSTDFPIEGLKKNPTNDQNISDICKEPTFPIFQTDELINIDIDKISTVPELEESFSDDQNMLDIYIDSIFSMLQTKAENFPENDYFYDNFEKSNVPSFPSQAEECNMDKYNITKKPEYFLNKVNEARNTDSGNIQFQHKCDFNGKTKRVNRETKSVDAILSDLENEKKINKREKNISCSLDIIQNSLIKEKSSIEIRRKRRMPNKIKNLEVKEKGKILGTQNFLAKLRERDKERMERKRKSMYTCSRAKYSKFKKENDLSKREKIIKNIGKNPKTYQNNIQRNSEKLNHNGKKIISKGNMERNKSHIQSEKDYIRQKTRHLLRNENNHSDLKIKLIRKNRKISPNDNNIYQIEQKNSLDSYYYSILSHNPSSQKYVGKETINSKYQEHAQRDADAQHYQTKDTEPTVLQNTTCKSPKTRERKQFTFPEGLKSSIEKSKGILAPEVMKAFLIHVKRKRFPYKHAKIYTQNIAKLVDQLELIVINYYYSKIRSRLDDTQMMWLKQLIMNLKIRKEKSSFARKTTREKERWKQQDSEGL
ncbi:retrovirus-related Pol polyprotein from transposon opus [Nephila pilipes]|uniref:Retrovirus-related Pol polyprotein from transposon opus n=1 Tax=Nephila pilipes TaxID=299642 RepID=A0A8X6J920_NEPPI|nr:retrovirus-related Pol polyprotein from transposon opus [Nephila pilipes]